MIKTLILLMIGVWLGLVLGLSFIEAPLKFQAPGISVPMALGIGKLVFGALNKIEIAFTGLLILFAIKSKLTPYSIPIIIGSLIAIIIIQSLVLLPELNDRVSRIVQGETIATSYHHFIFVGLEVTKLILLPLLFIRFQTFINKT